MVYQNALYTKMQLSKNNFKELNKMYLRDKHRLLQKVSIELELHGDKGKTMVLS